MHEVEIRPGIAMAYEDDCFAEPWTAPETVVMVHGNAESSRAWTAWVPHLADKYRLVRLDMPGFGASTAPPITAGALPSSPPTSRASWTRSMFSDVT